MRFTALLFISLLTATAASAQSQLVLRAQSTYTRDQNGNLKFADTITHIHLGGRNSTILVPPPSHFYPNNGVYNADTSYSKGYREYRKFNSAGLPIEYVKEKITTPIPELAAQIFYTYTPDMLPDTITRGGSRDIHFYNNGKPTRIEIQSWDAWTSTWQLFAQWLYNYDNGRLIEYRLEKWQPATSTWQATQVDSFIASGPGSDSTHIQYYSSGNVYGEQSRIKSARDASNRALVDSGYTKGVFSSVSYHSYDAQGRLMADSAMSLNSQQAQMQFTGKRTYTYDAQSNLTGITTRSYGNFPSGFLDSFTYNNTNQIIRRAEYDSASHTNGWELTGFGVQNYYYAFPVSVPEVATQNNLKLYPIPATSYINISMPFTKPQPFSVRIFDMQGRLVNQWQEAAQQTYNKQIPVLNMPPGQYTLHILAGSESVSRQFTVVR